METKDTAINIRLTVSQKEKIDNGAKARGVDRTSYILGLVDGDSNQLDASLYRKKAADCIRKVTVDIYGILAKVNTINESTLAELQPLLNEAREEVEKLWHFLK